MDVREDKMFRFMFSTTTALAAALMLLAGFSAQALEQKQIGRASCRERV